MDDTAEKKPKPWELQGFFEDCSTGRTQQVMAFLDVYPRIVNERDNTALFQTPLMLAAKNNQTAVMEVLLAKGAGVDWRDANQCSSLHHATFNGHYGATLILLHHHADITAKDVWNETPLQNAKNGEHFRLIPLLEGEPARRAEESLQRHFNRLKAAQQNIDTWHQGLSRALPISKGKLVLKPLR